MRFRINARNAYVGMGNRVYVFSSAGDRKAYDVDVVMGFPSFDANSSGLFWGYGNALYRQNYLGGTEMVGSILSKRTLFWVGESFGFGFYNASEVQRGFVFDVKRSGMKNVSGLPKITGHLLDAKTYFSNTRCWFFFTVREMGETKNHCIVLNSDGEMLASSVALSGDGSWLGVIRGKAAAKGGLFSVSDDGMVYVIVDRGRVEVANRFSDTEGLIQSDCVLQGGGRGEIYVTDRQRIMLLRCGD